MNKLAFNGGIQLNIIICSLTETEMRILRRAHVKILVVIVRDYSALIDFRLIFCDK